MGAYVNIDHLFDEEAEDVISHSGTVCGHMEAVPDSYLLQHTHTHTHLLNLLVTPQEGVPVYQSFVF